MDLRSARIMIFLVLGISLTWSASGKTSGNGSSTVTLGRNIRNNPFLQLITYPSAENNPFLHILNNRNQQPTSGNSSAESNPFLHTSDNNNNNYRGNPFLYAPANKIKPGNLNVDQVHQNTFSTNVTFINSNNPFLVISTNQRIDAETSNASSATQASTYASEFTASTLHASSPTTDSSHPLPFPIEAVPPTSSSPLLSLIQISPKTTRSEQKCDEYARKIAGVTEIVSLVGTSSDVIKVDNKCQNTNELVVGGTEAKEGEFPHMVALGKYDSDEKFVLMCGGTLISHTWILSAAHCTYGPNGSPSVARIGFHRLTDRKAGVTVSIKNMTRHPNYSPPAMYADIALLELEKTIKFTESIRPACLYQQYDSVPTSAWVSGWGVTEYAGDQTDRLQKAQLNLIDNLACTIQYNDKVSSREIPYGITPSMVCAGDPHGSWTKDTCQGDSGGPLQMIDPRNLCLFQVVGITSFGQGCANANIPGVYTRVSHYISWIENIVWPENQ